MWLLESPPTSISLLICATTRYSCDRERMRGQCWWKGGPENELAFALGAVKLGPFKFGKDKNEVKTYKFFVSDGQVRMGSGEGNRHEISGQAPWNVLVRHKPTFFHIYTARRWCARVVVPLHAGVGNDKCGDRETGWTLHALPDHHLINDSPSMQRVATERSLLSRLSAPRSPPLSLPWSGTNFVLRMPCSRVRRSRSSRRKAAQEATRYSRV